MAAGNFAPSLARLTFVECALSSQLASNQAGVLFLSGHEVVDFCADPSQFCDTLSPARWIPRQSYFLAPEGHLLWSCHATGDVLPEIGKVPRGWGWRWELQTSQYTCLFVDKWRQQQIDGRRGLLQLWWQMHPIAKPCGNPVELFGLVFWNDSCRIFWRKLGPL